MSKQGFIEHHLVEALLAGTAEIDGNQELARHLQARIKLRLISMTDEELWEFAKLLSSPPERPVEPVYKGFKEDIEEHRAIACEWINDLGNRTGSGKEDNDDGQGSDY